jgi:hypothetical protein
MKNFATRISEYRQSWVDGSYENCAEILFDSVSHLLELKTLSRDELTKLVSDADTSLTEKWSHLWVYCIIQQPL